MSDLTLFDLEDVEPEFVRCSDGTDVHLLERDGRCGLCGLPLLGTVVAA